MRVEQQSQNIIDVVKQSIGPGEKSGAVLSQYTTGAAGAAVEKSSVSDNAKSVNLKDAPYASRWTVYSKYEKPQADFIIYRYFNR